MNEDLEGQSLRPMQEYVQLYNAGYPLHEIRRLFQQRRQSQRPMTASPPRSEQSPSFERYRDDWEEKSGKDSSTLSDGDWSGEDDERGPTVGKEGGFPPRITSRSHPHSMSQRPLIDHVRNDWRTDPRYRHAYPETDFDAFGPSDCLQIICARKIRRVIGFCVSTLVVFWISWMIWLGPMFSEHLLLKSSLDYRIKSGSGWFGANVRPKFADMVQLETLDAGLVPGAGKDRVRGTRLIVVGDVHGCNNEFKALLAKLSFDKSSDHLILAGDMISKGPYSADVVSLAISLNASCVRGNHEDRVLLAHRDMNARRLTYPADPASGVYKPHPSHPTDLDLNQFPHGDTVDRALADSFSKAEIDYLASCPVILKIGQVPGLGEVSVVHAGLVPGVGLERQDPGAVMSMRSIDLDTHVPSRDEAGGVAWTKLWNKYQGMLPRHARSTVIYGHDSKRGLVLEKWSKGMDTGCVKGGRLSALIIEDNGGWGGGVSTRVVSVGCRDYRPRDLGNLGQG